MTDPSQEALPAALTEHVGYLLVVLGKRAQRAFTEALEPAGLRPPHFDVLACLERRAARSQTEIARALRVEPAHRDPARRAERAGHVARTADPSDRRRYAVALTAGGAALTRRLKVTAGEVEAALVADLKVTEQAQLGRRVARVGVTPTAKPRRPRAKSR